LIFLPEEITHFTDSVVVGGPEGRIRGVVASSAAGIKKRIVNDIMPAVVGRSPGGISVPGEDPKFAPIIIGGKIVGLEVVDHVFVGRGPVIVVAESFDHGMIGVVFL
jgi:hypothetical protein